MKDNPYLFDLHSGTKFQNESVSKLVQFLESNKRSSRKTLASDRNLSERPATLKATPALSLISSTLSGASSIASASSSSAPLRASLQAALSICAYTKAEQHSLIRVFVSFLDHPRATAVYSLRSLIPQDRLDKTYDLTSVSRELRPIKVSNSRGYSRHESRHALLICGAT